MIIFCRCDTALVRIYYEETQRLCWQIVVALSELVTLTLSSAIGWLYHLHQRFCARFYILETVYRTGHRYTMNASWRPSNHMVFLQATARPLFRLVLYANFPCQLTVVYYDNDFYITAMSLTMPLLFSFPIGWVKLRLYQHG